MQSRKAFQSSRERLTKQGVAMRRSDHILTGLRSQREEKDIGETHHEAYGRQARITQKNGLGGDFGTSLLRILLSD